MYLSNNILISAAGTPRARATRSTCRAALAGLMSGSSPEAEVVSMSAGKGRATSSGCAPSRVLRSPSIRSIKVLLVGPRLDPPELAALYGAGIVLAGSLGSVAVVADRRPWNHAGPSHC